MAGFNVLPLGFSDFESATLSHFFKLASRRAPHWTLTSQLLSAKVVLVSANSQAQIDAIRGVVASWQTIILVGSSDFGTGWLTLPRPLNLNTVLTALNDLKLVPNVRTVTPKPVFAKTFGAMNLEAA